MDTFLSRSHKSTTVRSFNRRAAWLGQLAERWPELVVPWLARRFTTPARRSTALDLSDATQIFRVNSRGHSVSVGLWGKGPVVLLVHGWLGSGQQFAPLRQALVAAGHQVAAFDAPAHGATPGAVSHAGRFLEVAQSVVDWLGPMRAAVGHSLGALAIALLNRGNRAASCSVLLAPMPSLEFAVQGYAQALALPRAVQARLLRHWEPELGLSYRELDVGHALREQRDVLVVHDRADRQIGIELTRSWLKDLENGAPWAERNRLEFVESHGLGHARLLKDPATIERIVRFISAAKPPSGSNLERALCSLPEF